MDRIADWSQADLRRFIVSKVLTDPGAFPKSQTPQKLPSGASDGNVPVWDQPSSSWVTSTAHKVPYSQLNLASSVTAADLATGIVLQLGATGTARKVGFGTATATWTASQFSANVTIAHGLGVTPIYWAGFSSDAGQVIWYFTGGAPTGTNIVLQGAATGSISGTKNLVWAAIG